MWDPEPTYDVLLNKLSQVACLNPSVELGFRSLSEIIRSDSRNFLCPVA